MSTAPDGLEARDPIPDADDEPRRGRSQGWTLGALALSAAALALLVRRYVPTAGAPSPAPIASSRPEGANAARVPRAGFRWSLTHARDELVTESQ